jgi:integrase
MPKYGSGSIDDRGNGSFRLRYVIDRKSFTKTIHAESMKAARSELAKIVGTPEKHVAPSRITLEKWGREWLKLLKRGRDGEGKNQAKRRRGQVNPRTIERYEQLIEHAIAALGNMPLQKITATMIDNLYMDLEQKLATRTILHLHNVLRPCLASAMRKKLISENPCDLAEIPNPGDAGDPVILDEDKLAELVRGFRSHDLEMIVDLAAHCGARRNELIALSWDDINIEQRTITISKSVEDTVAFGRHLKEPKTAKGKRTIAIDPDLTERLRAYRDRMKREIACVPDDGCADLRLIKLPKGCLLFPGRPEPGQPIDYTKLRDGHAVTRTFKRHAAKLGFDMKFHQIRSSHLTLLLDAGMPVHVVAKRAGHDPVTLLASYARWTRKTDAKVADVLSGLSKRSV